jgi:hypothetical protein
MKPTRVRIFALYLTLVCLVTGTLCAPAYALHTNGSMCLTSFNGPDPTYNQYLGGLSSVTFFPCKLDSGGVDWAVSLTNSDTSQSLPACNPSSGKFGDGKKPVCGSLPTGATILVTIGWTRVAGGSMMYHYHYLTN